MESEITTRSFVPVEDYEMICDWWQAHHTAPVPLELLPECGFVAFDDEHDLLAGWVYFDTTTPVCFASHLVSRPGLRWALTTKASEAILAAAKEYAFCMGARLMMMYAPKAIARHAERHMGFIADKRELTNLVTVVTEEAILCP